MQDREVITIPKKARNLAVGKIIAVVLIGFVVGYVVALGIARDYERGQQLTLQKYTADFEKHRNRLLEPVPLWASVVLAILFSGAVFGVYEVIGGAFGRLVGRVLR